MTYKGIAKGKTIELEEPLPFSDGQRVSVWVEPVVREGPSGSPALVRRAMHAPPHLQPGDVEELERAIEEARLPVRPQGPFDR